MQRWLGKGVCILPVFGFDPLLVTKSSCGQWQGPGRRLNGIEKLGPGAAPCTASNDADSSVGEVGEPSRRASLAGLAIFRLFPVFTQLQ